MDMQIMVGLKHIIHLVLQIITIPKGYISGCCVCWTMIRLLRAKALTHIRIRIWKWYPYRWMAICVMATVYRTVKPLPRVISRWWVPVQVFSTVNSMTVPNSSLNFCRYGFSLVRKIRNRSIIIMMYVLYWRRMSCRWSFRLTVKHRLRSIRMPGSR